MDTETETSTNIEDTPLYSEPTIPNYIIPRGLPLWHASIFMETFNPLEIRLSKDNNLVAFFTDNEEFALSLIKNCNIHPESGGFLHEFRVKRDIDRIKILSIYDIKAGQKDIDHIQKTYCNGTNAAGERYNGIGMFYPKHDTSNNIKGGNEEKENDTEEVKINNKPISGGPNKFIAEFALCNPTEYLEYLNTKKCIAFNKLSSNYRFDE